MQRAITLFLAGALLAGCANLDYASDNYGTTPMVRFEHQDHPYRIFDKPSANRLMITSSIGSAIGSGFVRGLTFGLLSNHPSEPTMRAATEAYLASTSRKCSVEAGNLIAQPQWEFRYECEALSGVALKQP